MKHQTRFLQITPGLFLVLIVGLVSVVHAQPATQPSISVHWSTKDIGAVGRKGTFTSRGNTFTITGAGNDIWGGSDQFRYVYTPLSGNGQLVAHLLSQHAKDGWAKAGLMLRETLAGNAAYAFLALTPRHKVIFQSRKASGSMSAEQREGVRAKVPVWLKLVRHDAIITGFISKDGSTWLKVSSVTMSLQATVFIGLAVTAHVISLPLARRKTEVSSATFTHVVHVVLPTSGPVSLNAMRVYGQGDSFTTATENKGGVSANSLNYPWGMALDSHGNLYIADCNNNRVLYYPAGSTTATRVYGQGGSFTTTTANKGGVSATSLAGPEEITLDSSDNLYVANDSNNRVLYYPAGSTTATRVYGQGGSFTTATANKGGVSATSLAGPTGVTLDSAGNLYVTDYNNNRVLYYPAGSTTATRVYGQGGSFTTATTNKGGVSATSLNEPWGVRLDSGSNLYVADSANSRVLYYPAGSTTATRVYGQGGSFTTATTNKGGVSATSLTFPLAVALDSADNLYIEDDGNNRVLYYPAGSTTATRVYGQGGSFTTATANKGGVSASSFNDLEGMMIDGSGNLYVADSGNNRVLMFPHT